MLHYNVRRFPSLYQLEYPHNVSVIKLFENFPFLQAFTGSPETVFIEYFDRHCLPGQNMRPFLHIAEGSSPDSVSFIRLDCTDGERTNFFEMSVHQNYL